MESFEGKDHTEEARLKAIKPSNIPESMVRGPSLKTLYSIVECISKGSPGTVYIVQDKRDDEKYVMKKIECHDESAAIKAFFENVMTPLHVPLKDLIQSKLLNERRAVFLKCVEMELKRLDHPYVCSYKEFFVTYEKEESSVFINVISDYFPDGSLQELISSHYEKEELIPEQKIQKILGEMLESLNYIHEKGLIHRGIKPSNIFLKPDGAVVLGDLGVSTVMSDMRTNTRATFRNTVYLGPETDKGPHVETSDFYSFGCVLLQLTTATNYSPQTFVTKLRDMKEDPDIRHQMFERVSENYSSALSKLLNSLLKQEPSQRLGGLELEKNPYVKECMVRVDSTQLDKRSRQSQTKFSQNYALTENRKDVYKVLEYVANTIDHEECVADGLSALAEIIRDDEKAHEQIDQQARNLISLAMWDNIFNPAVQISGCYVLSNLVVYSEPNDILFTPEVITILHKIMTSHGDNTDVQLAAVNFVLALSADERASGIIVQLNGIQDILNAMRVSPYHASLCAVSCMAIWSLTVHEENLKIASQNDAVKDVGRALNTHKISPKVCEAAAAALVSLLLDDSCYEPFNELDCVGNLVAAIALHTKNSKVVRNCCKVLTTVVEANEECAFRFLTSDNPNDDSPTGIPTLLEAYRLHKDDAMVVEAIVRLLLELSSYGEICLDLRAAKFNTVLVEIRRKFIENKDINVEMQAALVGPLVLSEVHKRYKENRDIMGPVEEALDKLGSGVARASKTS